MRFVGLAAPFVETTIVNGVIEWIDPSAFTLADGGVSLLYGTHDGFELATMDDDTLELRIAAEGLLFSAQPQWRSGLASAFAAVRRGGWGASVLMRPGAEETEIDGTRYRCIARAELLHVAITCSPAYVSTSAYAIADDDTAYDLSLGARHLLTWWDCAYPLSSARSAPAPRMSSSGLTRARYPRAGRAEPPSGSRVPESVNRVLARGAPDAYYHALSFLGGP